MRFQNKLAVVTGAGQGIGETYARRLAAEGARVIIAELNEAQGSRVAADLGDRGRFVKVDVSDPVSCEALADVVRSEADGLDILINNAAIFAGMRYDPLLTVDLEYYMKFMAVNFHGSLFVTRALKDLLISRKGAIVNQSSTAAYMLGGPGAYYSISKLGTNALTAALASELGPVGVRVNGIAPGPTSTEAMQQVDAAIIEGIVAQMPLGRLGTTDEQADAALFLLSDDAKFITGQTLCVDGGMIRRT